MVLGAYPERKPRGARLEYDVDRGLFRLSFKAMGTPCRVLFAGMDKPSATAAARASLEWVARFEGKYSRFLDTSLIAEMNRCAGASWVSVDLETERILSLCDDLHFMTGGLLDPTLLPLIELWDYRFGCPRRLPNEDEIETAKSLVGWEKVERCEGAVFLPRPGMRLDFGGFGKEYAVDEVAGLVMSRGASACLVDFGQDIRAIGAPPDAPSWLVGLEDPQAPGTTWTTLAIVDAGVATSGDYWRFFEFEGRRFGHIVDPRSGRPVANGVLSATVVASSCLEAGALSTSAYTAGLDEGATLIQAHFQADGCLLTASARRQTSNFDAYVAEYD